MNKANTHIKWLESSQVLAAVDRAEIAAEMRRLAALVQEWESKAATWLASPEAAQRLEGYRDLAQQLNAATEERDALRAELERIRALEPVAWAWFADNGNIRLWSKVPPEAGSDYVDKAVPLITLTPKDPT